MVMIRIISGPLFIAPSRASFNFWLFAQKCEHLPPPPYISETAFSHRFQKVYIYPPKRNNILAHWAKSAEKPVKMPKPTELAQKE